jgi:hypothetical protein
MANSFSGGRSRSTRIEPPTMDKQLVSLITCGCQSCAPFFVIYKAGREPSLIKYTLPSARFDFTTLAVTDTNSIVSQPYADWFDETLYRYFLQHTFRKETRSLSDTKQQY